MDIEFEWDEAKNQANLQKHGISFETAAVMLASGSYLKRQSKYSDEVRFEAVGKIDNNFYTAIYTIRQGRVRVISVRRARENERSEYNKIYS